MTFEAYITNIRAKTGKDPKDFFDEAVRRGALGPETRTMEFVAWLKAESGLGHGHAMAVWEAFKRNGWIPVASPPGKKPRSRSAQGSQQMRELSPPDLWRRRIGIALSALVTIFFVADAAGKLLQAEPVLRGTRELGWPQSAVFPLGVLLLVGAVLYVVPRTALLGAIYLTGFLGGAVATHYRVGSPLGTHVLFGLYVAAIMWTGLALRDPRLLAALLGRRSAPP